MSLGSIAVTWLLFAAGIVLIVKGGDLFVDAAGWIAQVSGIPKFIVGATIVSVATTMPEIIVSVIAALEDKVDMAVGNAVGSVTVNTAVILSLSMIFMDLPAPRREYLPKGLLFLGAAVLLYLPGRTGELAVWGVIALAGIFVAYLLENLGQARSGMAQSERVSCTGKELAYQIALFLLGAAGVVAGSRLLVDNGSILAEHFGVPERVIALTLVSVGTSLPELVTAVSALIKREAGLSAGNVIGANILDLTLVLPAASAAYGGALPVTAESLRLDFPFCILVSAVAILPVLVTEKFHRWQGIALIVLYVVYLYLTLF